MRKKKYDFSGYATRNDLKCTDGRVIRKNAFADCDGMTVPLVYQHCHDDVNNVLGHVLLENRDDGVFAYGTFNDTVNGQNAKKMVQNGDISALSIYANRLKQNGQNVLHGAIREVSLVLAGANPGAYIENITLAHADGSFGVAEDEAIIYVDDTLSHADDESDDEESNNDTEDEMTLKEIFDTLTEKQKNVAYFIIGQAVEDAKRGATAAPAPQPVMQHAEGGEETVADVWETFNEQQKNVVYLIIENAVSELQHDDGGFEYEDYAGENPYYDDVYDEFEDEYDEDIDELGDSMKHNVFDTQDYFDDNVLSHSDFAEIVDDARTNDKSLKNTFLEHGITNIDYLFPDARLDGQPNTMDKDHTWVSSVLDGVTHSPFAKVKSLTFDITADEARAKGYTKGAKKKEEVFALLKRTTDPQTIYKKQSIDRDDMVDITSLDVVGYLKAEMRLKLDEELARAILIGDGRTALDEDKIKEDHIRPIFTDEDLYTVHHVVTYPATVKTNDDKAAYIVDEAVRALKDYEGSQAPVLFTSREIVSTLMTSRDKNGLRMYKTMDELAGAMRVSKIVEVPQIEGAQREKLGAKYNLLGIMVSLKDYKVGADKGGEVNMFDDFDIDYNKMKYLIETRCSGALVKPHSAISLEVKDGAEAAASTVKGQ